ncbi:MAG: hypothetical protein J2P23_10280 [Microlunatus sp.]|nr:hypothetical protein [Microlunatus sp.]
MPTLLTLVAAVVLTACDTSPTPDAARPAPTVAASPSAAAVAQTVTMSCDMPIAGERHPRSKPILNVVPIEAVDRQSVLGTTGPPYDYFGKTGLNIRAGRRTTLRAIDQGSNRVAIGWGTNGIRWTKELIVPACTSPTDHSPWLIYPGGFVTDTPACISLDVTSGDHTSRLDVPVGKACP